MAGGWKSMVGGRKSTADGWWSMVGSQRAVVGGRQSTGGGPQAVDGGRMGSHAHGWLFLTWATFESLLFHYKRRPFLHFKEMCKKEVKHG